MISEHQVRVVPAVAAQEQQLIGFLAEEYGYKVVYIHLTTQYKSVHNVPDAVVERMRESYTDLSDYEKGLVVGDDMSDELKELLAKVGA